MEETSLVPKENKEANALRLENANREIGDTIYEKFKMEFMKCSSCPILHDCAYPKKRLESIKDAAHKASELAYEEEIALDGSQENVLRAQQKRKVWFDQQVRLNIPKELAGERCIYEKRETVAILQRYSDANYDMKDPRVYMILNELVGNVLQVGRMNKAFTSQGMLLAKETAGGPVYYANPLLKARTEFSNLVIEATESIDRMLKSDEKAKADKSFTDYLLQELKIGKMKKMEGVSKETILDAEFTDS